MPTSQMRKQRLVGLSNCPNAVSGRARLSPPGSHPCVQAPPKEAMWGQPGEARVQRAMCPSPRWALRLVASSAVSPDPPGGLSITEVPVSPFLFP